MSTGYVFFTGAACGLLLLAAAKLAISYRRQLAGRWLFLLLTGVFSYLVHPLAAPENAWLKLLLDLPTDLVPAAFWLFAFSLCSDSGKFPRSGWILIALSVIVSGAANLGPSGQPQVHEALYILAQPLKLSLLAAGLITLVRQFQSDLVEARRRLRAALLIAVGGYMLIVVCAEFLFSYQPVPAGVPTLHALLASLLTLTACLWLLALSPTALDESLPPSEEREKKKTPPPETPPPLDKPQQQLLKKLQAHMHAGGYRHTGLTIRELAEQLGAREHVLRTLINRHLGYRNFNEYLNQFRIDEASRRLADPEQAHLPVLTIALDIGYRSLSPFNAAFKRRHKQTPTEYRREKLPLQEV
ncbi:helix-turn-helix transcriptional regulator [Microbulbifer thermotolerans]|uniref:helix-turn-helix transcriptional regulator n=1 Tax=Microbulbifer thermotolerans TaxID=252514 RepID=UPI002248B414|nr:helix-turn-helix transcriptional regulator [Microbulbifer thermotolerans]MCX2830582.1 helix-turn-helix transcriptional regulator [Microbulbifer thermotolerans]